LLKGKTMSARVRRWETTHKQKGFSLIELLIVVAIILIIAAIAIPNLLRARIAANESSAVSAVRTIHTAEVTYSTLYPTVGYAANLLSLGGASPCTPVVGGACLIDNVLATASATPGKSGYIYRATPVAAGGFNTGYTVGASPLTYNQSGVRNFCANEDGVSRYSAGASGSTPVITNAACIAFTALP
jgi:type IV pilus assembly protein PilA